MSVIFGSVAWTICIAMLALTTLCQRPRWKWLRDLKYNDVGSMIPAWTFFAPNPGTTDTRVLWRERLLADELSPWQELLPPANGLLRAVWNPNKRQAKLLTDVGPMVVRLVQSNPKSELALISLPYLVMLHRVMAMPASPLVTARQFLVVQTTGSGLDADALRPLFASRWHAFDHAKSADGSLVPDPRPAKADTPRTPENA